MPDGWLQVIRGLRPQSVKWPAQGKVRDPQVVWKPSRQPPRQERAGQPSRDPEAVVNEAIGEIKSLQAAIDLVGPASVHAKPLLIALKAAQERSKMGPVQERLDSCREPERSGSYWRSGQSRPKCSSFSIGFSGGCSVGVRFPHVGADHERRVVLRLSGEFSVQPGDSLILFAFVPKSQQVQTQSAHPEVSPRTSAWPCHEESRTHVWPRDEEL